MAGRLAGKVALISGAARGQGEVEGRLFAQEGAKVVLGDILVDLGKKVADDIQKQGGQATFVALDVTKEANWQSAVDMTVQTYGKLDILVNNAGIFRTEGVEATSMELWNQVIAVNQTGVWLGMKYSVPAMRKAGGGSIINISSGAGIIGTGMAAAYHATKGAVRILRRLRRLSMQRTASVSTPYILAWWTLRWCADCSRMKACKRSSQPILWDEWARRKISRTVCSIWPVTNRRS